MPDHLPALPAIPHPAAALEQGAILRWPAGAFPFCPLEQSLIRESRIGGEAKNISYNRATAELRHATGTPEDLTTLSGLLDRYAAFCEASLAFLLPEYSAGLTRMRTSFRPAEIAGRVTSWRRDDTQRHVDAFPSSPTGGKRILRMFCNADQSGRPRHWRTGPSFEQYAEALLPKAKITPIPGLGALRALTGLTKSRATLYDAQMLALHDAAKRDQTWQQTTHAEDQKFAPGEIWIVYTDLVPHAALSGANALEQTFMVDPKTMVTPEASPLAILSRRTARDMRRLI